MVAAPRKHDFHNELKYEFPTGKDYTGEIGVEIEVEGRNLPREFKSYWTVHKEGSLRGESAEYVLTKPASRKIIGRLLDYLAKQLEKAGAVCNMSIRTSVHVHVNMNDKTLIQCYNCILCYLIVEEMLMAKAGPTRVGNVFCLRANDAEYLVDFLTKSAKRLRFDPDPDQMRYSSVNVCSIPKFNSLEFRGLEGTINMDTIKAWINMLLSIKDASLTYTNPEQIIGDLSKLGPETFLKKLLPNDYEVLKVGDWQSSMWRAVRLIQEIAYAQNWKPKEKKESGRMFCVTAPEEPEPEWNIDG